MLELRAILAEAKDGLREVWAEVSAEDGLESALEARLARERRAERPLGLLEAKSAVKNGRPRGALCRSACSRPCSVPARTPQHVSGSSKRTPPATGSPDGRSKPTHERTPLPMVSSRE